MSQSSTAVVIAIASLITTGCTFVPQLCESSEAMKVYLEEGGNPNITQQLAFDSGDYYLDVSLLSCAISNDNKPLVELLLSKGADVNLRNEDGSTPLHTALSSWQNQEIVYLLINEGADVNAKDRNDRTPLHFVTSREVAELLIRRKADVNARDSHGNTPLHEIAAIGSTPQEEEESRLKEAELNTNSPLLMVARIGSGVDVAKLLIANGADIRARNSKGQTPLHEATSRAMIELLITDGADVRAKDNFGRTSLHYVLQYGNSMVEAAALLIHKGASVDARDQDGETPLHWTARVGNAEGVEFLLANGAQVSIRNNAGTTPLGLAIESHHLEVVELLRSREEMQ